MMCPHCGWPEVLIAALIWVRYKGSEGTDADDVPDRDREFSDASAAWCDSCGWRGEVGQLVDSIEV